MKVELVVTGIPETTQALKELDRLDYSKAETEAGKAVLDTVKGNTRSESGNLAGAWQVADSKFINTVEYASYQEFGTAFVPATFAVFRAWESEQRDIEKAFEREIENAASKIGFDT